MVVGNATTRSPPAFGGGSNLDPDAGPIQPVQFTCPRSSYTPASYSAGSDGTTCGMQDPGNLGAGAGFPLYPCDGYASPLRADVHFPSCYNPDAGLDDYKNNMAWPTSSNGKQNCPSGYIHVPHLFFESYWNTPLFNDLWTPDGQKQPFVLANGDRTGYSLHGDFLAGWDAETLQAIIDTCDAGDAGMDNCPSIPGGLNTDEDCKIVSPIVEALSLTGPMEALPGNNPVSGWGVSADSAGSSASYSASSSAATSYSAPSAGGATTYISAAAAASATAKSLYVSVAENPVAVAASASATALAVASASAIAVAGYTAVAAGDEPSIVWDIVTVTQTTTVFAEETGPAKRHVHAHDHMARHLRAGHAHR